MNGDVRSVIGVDIGNSGLRMAKLRLPLRIDAPQLQCLEPVARIDWRLQPFRTTLFEADSNSVPSYAPGDPKWLGELERLADSASFQLESRLEPEANHGFGTDGTDETDETYGTDGIDGIDGTNKTRAETAANHWFISSVRRDALSLLLDFLSLQALSVAHVISWPDIGFEVAVEYPERVGIDRLLAARGAMAYEAERPLIVVQAGSAVTVDWVTAESVFAGGAIVPGVPMMLRLLSQAADMLPEVEASELIDLPPLPGKNTEEAMRCGVSSAVVGGIQHLIERYRAQSSLTVPVILSGGDGPRLAKHLTSPIRVIDQLVLRGIAIVAAERLKISPAPGHVVGRT